MSKRYVNFTFLIVVSSLFIHNQSLGFAETTHAPLKRYSVFELELVGSSYSNPYVEAPPTEVTFTSPINKSISVPAFWSGAVNWLVRFTPIEEGSWHYRVSSGDEKINNRTGSFSVGGDIGGLNGHGFVEIDPDHHNRFRYSDGTPFFFLGHSIEWYRQGNLASGEYRRILEARSRQGFSVLVGYAGPGLGKYIFSGNESGPPFLNEDLDQLNPAHFQEADQRLHIAIENGFTVTVALGFADQDIWDLDREKLERAWKYVMARYAAYPIIWQPIAEYDDRPIDRAVELARMTRSLDPYDHPLSLHPRVTSGGLAGEPWFDFIIHQNLKDEAPVELIRKESRNNLPVIEEEHRVEDPDLVRRAAWRHLVNGAYYTLTMANYVIDDQRTKELSYLRNFVENIPFQKMEPHPELVDRGDCLTDPGIEYVIYLPSGGTVNLNLQRAYGTFSVHWYDPRSDQYLKADSISGRSLRAFRAPDGKDWILHIKRMVD